MSGAVTRSARTAPRVDLLVQSHPVRLALHVRNCCCHPSSTPSSAKSLDVSCPRLLPLFSSNFRKWGLTSEQQVSCACDVYLSWPLRLLPSRHCSAGDRLCLLKSSGFRTHSAVPSLSKFPVRILRICLEASGSGSGPASSPVRQTSPKRYICHIGRSRAPRRPAPRRRGKRKEREADHGKGRVLANVRGSDQEQTEGVSLDATLTGLLAPGEYTRLHAHGR